MKFLLKFRILLLILFMNHLLEAQICSFSDDYSNSTSWTWVNPFSSCSTPLGTLSVTMGVGNFNAVRCCSDQRIYQNLGFTLNNKWRAEIEFAPTAGGQHGVGHVILALTDQNLSPHNSALNLTGPDPITDQDGIWLEYLCPLGGQPNTYFIRGHSKLGTVYGTPSANIPLPLNQKYKLVLERLDPMHASITVYDSNGNVLGYDCFLIDPGINNLDIVQHGTIPQGSYGRVLTAKVDNLCIENLQYVAPGPILGPSTICVGTSGHNFGISPIPNVQNYQWGLPGNMSLLSGQGTNLISTNAGNLATSGYITLSLSYSDACLDTVLFFPITIEPFVANVTLQTECDNPCGGSIIVVPDACPSSNLIYTISGPTSGGGPFVTLSNSTGIFAPLCWGDYLVTVTSPNPQMTLFSQTYHLNAPLSLSLSVTNVCNGAANAVVTPVITGGTAPFTYYINGMPSNPPFTGLTPGIHQVDVVDANGCRTGDSFELPEVPLFAQVQAVQSCSTMAPCNIDITIYAYGGVGPYTYLVNGVNIGGTTAMGLCVGDVIEIIDSYGCTFNHTITTGNISYWLTGPNNICISQIGGSSQHIYNITNPPNCNHSYIFVSPGNTITYLSTTTTSTQISVNWQSLPATITVYFSCPGLNLECGPLLYPINGIQNCRSAALVEENFQVAPNPSTDKFLISWESLDGVDIGVYDLSGKMLLKRTFSANEQEYTLDLTDQPAGMYFLHYRSNGQTSSQKIIKQ